MPKRFWPDTKWKEYWSSKRKHARGKGIPFHLSNDEALALTHQLMPEYPSPHGWHLGRIDHDKGYEVGNVEWQTAKDNISEANRRRYD